MYDLLTSHLDSIVVDTATAIIASKPEAEQSTWYNDLAYWVIEVLKIASGFAISYLTLVLPHKQKMKQIETKQEGIIKDVEILKTNLHVRGMPMYSKIKERFDNDTTFAELLSFLFKESRVTRLTFFMATNGTQELSNIHFMRQFIDITSEEAKEYSRNKGKNYDGSKADPDYKDMIALIRTGRPYHFITAKECERNGGNGNMLSGIYKNFENITESVVESLAEEPIGQHGDIGFCYNSCATHHKDGLDTKSLETIKMFNDELRSKVLSEYQK